MKYIAIILFLGALICSGCVDEEIVKRGGNAPEGKPAVVNLKVDMPTMGSRTRSQRASEDQIDSLQVMIFDKQGNAVYNRQHKLNDMRIATYSGNDRNIYLVGNAVQKVDSALRRITTEQELKDLVVEATDLSYGTEKDRALMMTAVKTGVSIQPGNATAIEMEMKYMAAKVILKVFNEINPSSGKTLTFGGWQVIDVPKQSYLLPREKGDAVDTLQANDWLTTTKLKEFTTVKATGSEKEHSLLSFHLFENRRGGRRDRAFPTNQYQGMNINDTDARGKAWFRPERATAVVIHGNYGDAQGSKPFRAYIYLGGNNFNDYNILRGNQYTFTVTVKGFNEITIDTNIEYAEGDLVVVPADTVPNMDAHPDYRYITIHAAKGTVNMEILDSQNRTYDDPSFDATWLKISPMNLMLYQVKQEPRYSEWQQEGRTKTIVRGRYIPHKSVRATLPENKKWWTNYTEPNKEVTERPNDDELKFKNATYRMCYKIDDIFYDYNNESTTTKKYMYIYADEYLKPKGTPRKASIRLTYYKSGNLLPQEKIISVKQDGYVQFFKDVKSAGLATLYETGNVASTKKKFVLEDKYELKMDLLPDMPTTWKNGKYMQWGLKSETLYGGKDKYRNGKYLTADAVYTDVQRDTKTNDPIGFGQREDSYRPMYGRGDLRIYPEQPLDYRGNPGKAPYYYPDFTPDTYHPIYNSSAARYCHEKNRDINGDGVIDEAEAHWYMPAQQQVMLMHTGRITTLTTFNAELCMSVTGSDQKARFWTVNLVNDILTDNYSGRQESGNTSEYPKTDQKYDVRCIRDLP